jgi:huntingtin
VVLVSDVFTEKQQYEWMLDTLLEVHRTHPAEDDLILQYLVLGISKAAAIVGMVSILCS